MKHNFIHPLSIQSKLTDPRVYKPAQHKKADNTFANEFTKALEQTGELSISKHAKKRMEERKIHISSNKWQQIETKVNEASQKGVNDSLVLLDNAALIVSTKNKTVITMMDRREANTQIFTNINGTIVID